MVTQIMAVKGTIPEDNNNNKSDKSGCCLTNHFSPLFKHVTGFTLGLTPTEHMGGGGRGGVKLVKQSL